MRETVQPTSRRAPRRRRRSGARRIVVIGLIVLALAGVFATWMFAPRPSRFYSFDPVAVGQAEAQLWRAYYEGRTAELAFDLARQGGQSLGLSPQASMRAGMSAASAAQRFYASRSREEAQLALPPLTDYFAELARAANLPIDPAEAARLELEWWQLRRENVGPEVYAPAVANATAYLYGVEPARLERYARLRVQAMELRDSRREAITEADWQEITSLLIRAYGELRTQVSAAAPAPVT